MTILADDDDQREYLLGDKRKFDLFARLLSDAFETGASGEDEEEQRNKFLIGCVVRGEATRSLLGKKRKIDESEIPQSPNPHDASSPSLSPVACKRRLLVPKEPIRAEPLREIKPPVRERQPVRGNRPGEIKPPVRAVRRVTPEWLVNLMREENGVDAKLIIEKKLKASDLNTGQARLLMPFNQITEMDFLNEAELNIIDQHQRKVCKEGVEVTLVDSRGERWKLNLKRWDMNSSSNYVLNSGWNNVFLHNRLQEDETIRLWSFHSQGRLFFAMVPPPPALAMPQAQPPDAAPAPAPALAQAQAPFPAAASSSTPVPVLAGDSDEAEEARHSIFIDLRRIFVNCPRRRRSHRVLISHEETQEEVEGLALLARACAEMAPPLEAVQETDRKTLLLSDTDLRSAEILLQLARDSGQNIF